ncbi:MAG: ABC transporter substrate-binding protein, partial [Gammaproteobacteria bacterium]|nr:ABC transporter substrate-binding protein [Gammaproteobacteria bacterium]
LPLYSVFTVDAIALPRLQKANLEGVLGSKNTQTWSPDLDNAANKKFVSAYMAKHGGYPSFYGAQAYDSIMLIKSAVEAVNGDLSNKDAVRNALRAANYDSVRGRYTYGNNGMPIQNFYLREVTKDSEGRWTTKVVETVYTNHQDRYAKDCSL